MATNKDYYKILGVARTASFDDIKKAYHSLAIKFHPDKNPAPDAGERFKEISEAYRMLSNPVNRMRHDSNYSGVFFQTNTSGNQYPFDMDKFKFDMDQFKTDMAQFKLNMGQFKSDMDQFKSDMAQFPFNTQSANTGSSFHFTSTYKNGCYTATYSSQTCSYTTIVNNPVHFNVPVTLEELLTGVTKRHTMKRRTYDPIKDIASTELKNFDVVIPPGCSNLSTVTYPKESHRDKSTATEIRTPGDVVFTIKEDPHSIYKRNGANLECRKSITIVQSLNGVTIDVPALDGRTLYLRLEPVIKPGTVQRIQGEGLPYEKQSKKRGDIVVTIDFPEQLSKSMLTRLKEFLS